jgi:hypothetical protein
MLRHVVQLHYGHVRDRGQHDPGCSLLEQEAWAYLDRSQ